MTEDCLCVDRRLPLCHEKVGKEALTSRISISKLLKEWNQIIWGFIPFIFIHPRFVLCYHWLQVVEKIKELNLITKIDFVLCKRWEWKALVPTPWWRKALVPTWRILLLGFDHQWLKVDRRLPLCHEKVGKEALTSRISISKLLAECNQIIWGFISLIHPRFVITNFRWWKNKRITVLDDRRLTLCHKKVKGQKTQSKAAPSWNARGHPPTWVLLSLTSGGRKVKELNLKTEDCLCVMQKLGGDTSINQQNVQIIGGMQPNYLRVYTSHPPQVCYHWLQVVEKIKVLNLMLMTEDWLCVMQS